MLTTSLCLQTIDFEKRQAKGFAKFDIPESIRERVLDLAQQAEELEGSFSLLSSHLVPLPLNTTLMLALLLRSFRSISSSSDCLDRLGEAPSSPRHHPWNLDQGRIRAGESRGVLESLDGWLGAGGCYGLGE